MEELDKKPAGKKSTGDAETSTESLIELVGEKRKADGDDDEEDGDDATNTTESSIPLAALWVAEPLPSRHKRAKPAPP